MFKKQRTDSEFKSITTDNFILNVNKDIDKEYNVQYFKHSKTSAFRDVALENGRKSPFDKNGNLIQKE